jgi:hypothetical protein
VYLLFVIGGPVVCAAGFSIVWMFGFSVGIMRWRLFFGYYFQIYIQLSVLSPSEPGLRVWPGGAGFSGMAGGGVGKKGLSDGAKQYSAKGSSGNGAAGGTKHSVGLVAFCCWVHIC